MQSTASYKRKEKPFDAEALLAAVGAVRDREAFVTLFNYYAPRLKSWLLKQGETPAAADEIVQNTFVSVWEKAHGFDPGRASASTWIFTVARNKRIDALRKNKLAGISDDEIALHNAVAETPDRYVGEDEAEHLNEAIDALPEDQARILRMAFFEDKSHSAIAKETHLPLGTVKSRLRLALRKLRSTLTGER